MGNGPDDSIFLRVLFDEENLAYGITSEGKGKGEYQKCRVACSEIPGEKDKEVALETFNDKVSYVLGMDIGASLKDTKTEINREAWYSGIEYSLYNREPRIDP